MLSTTHLDAAVTGLIWHSGKPSSPVEGSCYVDDTGAGFIYTKSCWVQFSTSANDFPPPFMPPTKAQMEKHPALKEAWEEFLVLKALLGV